MVYSTIYWNVIEFAAGFCSVGEKGRAAMNAFLLRITGKEFVNRKCYEQTITTQFQQEAALLASDCLLPNAQVELDQIRSAFPRVNSIARIIPNAVDPDVTKGVPDRFRSTTDIKDDFVLCLASISPRKNQLRLAEASCSLGLLLVLVGGCDDNNKIYLSQCLKAGGGKVKYIGAVAHDAVRDAIAACRVHVLASVVETPGLATLEAAACGKSIVVCDRGSVREYVGDDAHYCEYSSVDSIRDAVAAAWSIEGSTRLSQHILTEYTWHTAAKATLAAYELVLINTAQCG